MASILIVDDHILNRQFLVALLGFDQHTLLVASDGLEGLAMAREQRPALIITDLLMPNMNGHEFVTRLRAEPALADIPVIFYTATYSMQEAAVMARSCDVRWVLKKPAAPDVILGTVREALGLPAKEAGGAVAAPADGTRTPIDIKLGEYLQELEQSRELMSRLAAGADGGAGPGQLQQVTGRLSQSLTDLQNVGLRLSALIDMGIEMSVERDPQRLLETACRVAQHISVARVAVIGIVGDGDGDGALRYHAVRGINGDFRDRLAGMPAAIGVLAGLLDGRQPCRLCQLDGHPLALGLPAWHPPAQAFLGVPVATAGRSYGWLYLLDRLGAPQFSEVDERAVATVATQLAVAYENLALYEKIRDNVEQLETDLLERRRITDRLHDSEERFRQLADAIDEVFFLTDPANSQMLYVSPAYEQVWGRSCASLYERPRSWYDALHRDDAARLGAAESRRRGGTDAAFDYRYRIVRPDGKVRWIHARGFPILDAGGKAYRVAGIAADITQQMQLQEALAEREAGLQRAQLVARMAHVVTGPDGVFENWSATLPQLLGLDGGALPPSNRDWLALVEPADRPRFRDTCIAAGRSGQRHDVEYRIRRGDGSVIHLQQVFEPLDSKGGGGHGARWFNTIQDVTEQKEQQQRIVRMGQIYAMLSGINSAIVRIRDRDELLREACRVAVSHGAFGMAWAGVLDAETGDGRVVASASAGGDDAAYAAQIHFCARAGGPGSDRPASVAVRDGRQVICNDVDTEPSMLALRGELRARGHRAVAALPLEVEGRVVAVIALFADEAGFFAQPDRIKLLDELAGDLSFGLQFIEKEERLNYLAYYDVLTGLPNGVLFHDRLEQFLHAAGGCGEVVAAAVVNVDHFVQLNEALGRHAGDQVLKLLAQRLQGTLQEPFSLARIGGDTFAIAFGGLAHDSAAATLLEQQVLLPLGQPFTVAQQEVRLAVRAGVAVYPADGADAESLFKHAEVALKKAKSSGERYLFYAPQMNAAIAARIALEQALREGLEKNQFRMHFQPRVDLMSGRVVSAEALMRWQHPERGMVSPLEFIPAAEESGLIVPLGDWAIEAVCAQQAAWQAAKVRIVPVAINLSAVQFKRGKVQESIRAAMQRHGLQPRHIEFELTESVVMGDPEQAIGHLQALKSLGVQLSLDDFGTGYSSLAYLKRFPFDFVKIDRAFITDITNKAEDAAIVTAVIAMAHSLGLRVVAEGVETAEQLEFLRRQRCDELQGYYFSRPVAGADFEAMLRANKRLTLAPLPDRRADTLLIVDDEAGSLSALRRLFSQDGYRVLTASGGAEALELLAAHPVQVILADHRMQDMSGAAFLDIAKELYPATVRIMLSGQPDADAVDEGLKQGAIFQFLSKPWSDEALREHIRDAFRRQRLLA
ncbi:EAL domain-containing protein [Janthinobacterium fluminis]|uniref:EAL domain-containing protein n=1 Tax=Janthinobacterium fluminis TaxID=2987524 RepID=A0ABT5JVY6_9BURK|nr:EAL domain-containing protein [Janthinobacterium fluminis]MDC8756893.1 EAL domain-containing protein [Janthinobacterium fluminis]